MTRGAQARASNLIPSARLASRAALPGFRLIGALIFLFTSTARGAPQLAYEADAACPTRPEFVQAVDERARSSNLDSSAAFVFAVSVQLRPDAGGFVGKLEIRQEDGNILRRELRDASCDALARALAFVLVIARRESIEQSAPRAEFATDERLSTTTARPAPPSSFRYGFGVEFGVRSAIAPSVSAFEVAEVELRERERGFPSWTFRAAFVHMQGSEYYAAGGNVDFEWNAGRWEVCPLRLAIAPVLDFTPCLGGHIGAIQASGEPSTPTGRPAEPTLFWMDTLAAARLELWATEVAALGLRGELSVPITRYDFAFYEPYSPVSATPALGLAASAALRVAFR